MNPHTHPTDPAAPARAHAVTDDDAAVALTGLQVAGTSGDTAASVGSAGARRDQINSDLARTVQQTTARRLAAAIADYDAALDRGAFLLELQLFDREVARAERAHLAAGGRPTTP